MKNAFQRRVLMIAVGLTILSLLSTSIIGGVGSKPHPVTLLLTGYASSENSSNTATSGVNITLFEMARDNGIQSMSKQEIKNLCESILPIQESLMSIESANLSAKTLSQDDCNALGQEKNEGTTAAIASTVGGWSKLYWKSLDKLMGCQYSSTTSGKPDGSKACQPKVTIKN